MVAEGNSWAASSPKMTTAASTPSPTPTATLGETGGRAGPTSGTFGEVRRGAVITRVAVSSSASSGRESWLAAPPTACVPEPFVPLGSVPSVSPSAPAAPWASNAATEACTGNPAAAASARAEASAHTMSSRLPRAAASRASRRKLIRDVARREPYGSTSVIRFASVERMRAAADVISSSTSR